MVNIYRLIHCLKKRMKVIIITMMMMTIMIFSNNYSKNHIPFLFEEDDKKALYHITELVGIINDFENIPELFLSYVLIKLIALFQN